MARVTYNSARGRFEFVGSYEERMLPKNAGFHWDPDARRWWTKDIDKAGKLSKIFDTEAQKQFDAMLAVREEAIRASRAAEATIEVPAPEGRAYLPFQLAGIKYAISVLNKQKGVIMGDEMGLGKTIQALGVANALGLKRIMVICPASLKLNWAREAERWLVEKLPIYIDKEPTTQTYLLITNYERLEDIMPRERDLLIIDEAHYIKNTKAKRSKLTKEHAKYAKRVLLLTGTPIANRPIELWHLLVVAGAEKDFGGFWNYARRYCNARETRWGWDFTGASNLGELQTRLRERWLVRRLKSEVLKELPPKIRQLLPIEPKDKRTRDMLDRELARLDLVSQYEEIVAQIRLMEALGKTTENEKEFRGLLARLESIKASFDEISSLRQDIGLSKVPLLAEHAENILEEEDKLVIFVHHISVAEALAEKLAQYKPVMLTGKQTVQARQLAVDLFQNDPAVRLFIGTLQASGVGITLTAAKTAVIGEIDWVPATIKQAEDRLHRIGQNQNIVLVQYLVYNNSLEAYMAEKISQKLEIIERALDGEVEIDMNLDTDVSLPVAPIVSYRPQVLMPVEPIDAETQELARSALRIVAEMDPDKARIRNEVGFSKFDGPAGRALAELETYSEAQAAWALKLAHRYRRQVPENMRKQIERAYAHYFKTTKKEEQ